MLSYTLYVHIAPNDKMYIGITKQNPLSRWKNGYGYAGSPHFYNAILKYGWDNFKHIILLENLSEEMACECEKYLIAKFQTTNREYGYNVCNGGEGTNGYHHTEKFKSYIKQRNALRTDDEIKKISETVKKRWREGRYKNNGNNFKGKEPWNKGLTKNDPRVAKYVRKVGEFHHTEETKLKLSNSHKGRPAHNRKKVMCIETEVIYNSVSDAQSITGINNISVAARFYNKTAGGLHWRYLENDNL